jgi:protein-S-isoprenylcysteine O-methyltransferase Ste14
MNKQMSMRGVGVALTNLMLALMFFAFAYANLKSFSEHPRLSVLLIVAVETIIAVFLLIRKDPDKTWHAWKTWVTTVGGTFAPLLLRPVVVTDDLLVGQMLQVDGFMLQIGAIMSLNRSFGLLPAHRGVKTDGLYRCVRHPLYTAYTIAILGYVINNPGIYNLAVFAVWVVFQVMRILNEERLLLGYPDYARMGVSTLVDL